jgi:hypothetical protein
MYPTQENNNNNNNPVNSKKKKGKAERMHCPSSGPTAPVLLLGDCSIRSIKCINGNIFLCF